MGITIVSNVLIQKHHITIDAPNVYEQKSRAQRYTQCRFIDAINVANNSRNARLPASTNPTARILKSTLSWILCHTRPVRTSHVASNSLDDGSSGVNITGTH